MSKFKVSKIMLDPSRTIGLRNYSSVKLSAGIEIVFDKPIDTDSKELKEASEEARKLIKEEFKLQLEAFTPKKKEANVKE